MVRELSEISDKVKFEIIQASEGMEIRLPSAMQKAKILACISTEFLADMNSIPSFLPCIMPQDLDRISEKMQRQELQPSMKRSI